MTNRLDSPYVIFITNKERFIEYIYLYFLDWSFYPRKSRDLLSPVSGIISRPGQSQGLLYKHLRLSLIH